MSLSELLNPVSHVVTAGVAAFADDLAAQGVPVTRVDWRPPMAGSEVDLADVAVDGRRVEANALAVRRMLAAGAELVDVRPAGRCWGWSRGSSCMPGRPSTWERASGPMRGALIGAVLFEGLADTPDAAESWWPAAAGVPRRRGPRARALPQPRRRSARWPASSRPVMWLFELTRPGRRSHRLVQPQRGPRQGAALRRLRARGDHAAPVDGRRARPDAPAGRARAPGRSTSRRSSRKCCTWATRAHNRNRAGTLMLLRELLPSADRRQRRQPTAKSRRCRALHLRQRPLLPEPRRCPPASSRPDAAAGHRGQQPS